MPSLSGAKEITMPHASTLACEGQTARLAAIIDADARFAPHKMGHTKKVLRFQAVSSGQPLAIEKRKGVPTVYIDAAHGRRSAHVFANASIKPAGLEGRNSNLGAIFADAELLAVKVTGDDEYHALLGCAL